MQDSRTKNSMRNITFGIINKVIALVLSFASRSIFIYCLGVEYLGIQGLFSDILAMLSLADLGFGTAMAFSMYKPLAENDKTRLAALTSFYKTAYRAIAATITIIGLALIPFLKYLVNTDTEIPHLTLYYVLCLANTVASYLVVYKTCILSADQKDYIITKLNSIFSFVWTVASCVFLLLTKNYIVYLVVQVVATYSKNFYISYEAEKRYPFICQKERIDKQEKRDLLKVITSGFIYKITSVILAATDNTLISVLVSTVAVGYYSNYTIVSNQLLGLIGIAFYALTPSLGNLALQGNKEKKYEVFSILQSMSMMLGVFCTVCLVFLQEDFIQVWLGKEYLLDRLVLLAVAFNLYITIILYPTRIYREAIGLYQKTKIIMIMTAGLNIVISIALGIKIGVAGIIFATSISKLLTYFWYEPLIIYKPHFGKTCLYYLGDIAKNAIILCFISFVEFNVCSKIVVTGWITLIAKGMIVATIAGVGVIIFYWRSEGVKQLLARVTALFSAYKRR